MNNHQKWLEQRNKVDTDYNDWITTFIKFGSIPSILVALLFIFDSSLPLISAEQVKVYWLEERIDNTYDRGDYFYLIFDEEKPQETFMHVTIYNENKPLLNRTSSIELSDPFARKLSVGDTLQIFRSRIFEVRKDVAKIDQGRYVLKDSRMQSIFFYIRVVILLLPILIYTKYRKEHLNLTLIAGSCGVILAGYEIWFLIIKYLI
ncbi:hypothetical protein [Fodinibius salsisoli]|uniref:Uncharacterized protein n=1 Tax=Fodinibius salsisoli TaxID=2820877 RepID=A0ABT3PSS4_9BACT|nr:hypothetical protein [Fodinibius salsisoli]MCW9708916.1 hypothetical protein [Fodinibius salsisoli]